MSAATNSAGPRELLRYAQSGEQLNNQLYAEANRLAGVLERFTASCTEYRVGVDRRLADKLTAYARGLGEHDTRVHGVGDEFERADTGTLLGWKADSKSVATTLTLGGTGTPGALLDVNQPLQNQIDRARSWLLQSSPVRKRLNGIAPTVATAVSDAQHAPQMNYRWKGSDLEQAWKRTQATYKEIVGRDRGILAILRDEDGSELAFLKKGFPKDLQWVAESVYFLRKHVVGFYIGFWEGVWDFLKGIGTLLRDAYKLITFDPEAWGNFISVWMAFMTNPGESLKVLWEETIAPIVEDWKAGRYGEAVGRVFFEVLPAILSIFTGGAASAGYLSKLSKFSKLPKVADNVEGQHRDGGRPDSGHPGGNISRTVSQAMKGIKRSVSRYVAQKVEAIANAAKSVRAVLGAGIDAIFNVARRFGHAVVETIKQAITFVKDIRIRFDPNRLYGGGLSPFRPGSGAGATAPGDEGKVEDPAGSESGSTTPGDRDAKEEAENASKETANLDDSRDASLTPEEGQTIPRHTSNRLVEDPISSKTIYQLRNKYSLDKDSEAAASWHVERQPSTKSIIGSERNIKEFFGIDPNKDKEKMVDLLKIDKNTLKIPIEVKNNKEIGLVGTSDSNAALLKFENIARQAPMEQISHFEVICHVDSKLPRNFRVDTTGKLFQLVSGSEPPEWVVVEIGGKNVYVKAAFLGEISK